MRALLIVDNRPDAGQGHLMRCAALAAELRTLGWDTESVGPTDTANYSPDVVITDVRPDLRVPQPFTFAPTVLVVDDAEVWATDLVVNGCAGATVEMYAQSGARRVLAGPQFSLLRPEFMAARSGKVRGTHFLDLRAITNQSSSEMAHVMAIAGVAITYGGMRAMECACVGTPSVVILSSDDGERLNVAGLLAAQACVVSRDDDDEPVVMARSLLASPALLDRMGRNAQNLVDGKGVKRVAAAIKEIVSP